jgi:hypothetical protein
VKCSYAKRVNKYWLGWNASWLKSLSVVKIDVCKLISLTNAQTLDEHRHTREKLKGNEVLCMTNLDVPKMIPILPRHCLIYDPDSSPSVTVLYMILILPRHAQSYIWSWFFTVMYSLIYDPDSSPSVPNNTGTDLKNNWNLSLIQYFILPFMGHFYIAWQFSLYGEESGYSQPVLLLPVFVLVGKKIFINFLPTNFKQFEKLKYNEQLCNPWNKRGCFYGSKLLCIFLSTRWWLGTVLNFRRVLCQTQKSSSVVFYVIKIVCRK